jgi:hypothetical protein
MVSFEVDDFILDKDKTYWSALLSDGRWVYQDDDRPGEEEPRSWVRLMKFCEENELYVKQMRIRFRSHEETMPAGDEGYFCRNRVLSAYGDPTGRTYSSYALGPIVNGKIHVQVWQIPEIIPDELEPSSVRNIEGNEEAIIWNKQGNSYLQIQAKNVAPHTT